MRFARNTRRLIYLTPLVLILIVQSTLMQAFNQILQPRSVFTVNTFIDTQDTNASDGICIDVNGNCSLRAAVMSANYTDVADEIILPVGTYNLTRNGTDDNALNGDLDILRSLTITGADRDTTIIVQTLNDKAFQINSFSALNITVSMSNLTVKNLNKYTDNLIENATSGILSLSNTALSTAYRGLLNQGVATVTGTTVTNMYNDGLNSSSNSTFTVNDTTISNSGASGIYTYYSKPVQLDTVTVTGSTGRGIYLDHSTSGTILNSVISNNNGGGIYGGGLLIDNALIQGNSGSRAIDLYSGKVLNSTITGNTAGGIYLGSYNSAEIVNSTISNNQATGYYGTGAGIYIDYYSTTKITGSTISGNTAEKSGGGIYVYTSSYDTSLTTITNSTISGNTTQSNGGGIYTDIPGSGTKLKLNGVTITGNSAISGGGIYANAGFIEPANTILYGNSATVSGANCYDTALHFISQGYNILGDNNYCPNFTTPGDKVGVNPLLSALADNGGLTWTHALQVGSPAINTGNPLTCIGYDQRYYPRNGTCDIGAYEADVPAETVTPTLANTSTPTITNTPTKTATATPTNTPTATNTLDPNVTPTVTNTSTVTSTPTLEGGTIELLSNGGFEARTGSGGPDLLPWALSNGSKDKIKCNTLTKDIAYEGECAFLFKGGAGENAKLSQIADSTGNFNVGDIVVFNLYINAKGAVNMKAKVKVGYSDSTPAGKINLTMASTSGYAPLQGYTFLMASSISKIKVQIINRSASGKIYLDAVSLLHSSSPFRLTGRILPLP